MDDDLVLPTPEMLTPYRLVIVANEPGKQRLIGSAGEMVRFFLPLPEALGLPNGWVRPRLREIRGPVYAAIVAATGERGHVLFEVVVSMCFLRVTRSAPVVTEAMEVAGLAAEQALPGLVSRSVDPPTVEQPYTVVEVAAIVHDRSEDELSRVFDAAVDAIADVQASYATATGQSVTLLTKPRCPLFVPMYFHAPDADPSTWHSDNCVFFVHDLVEQMAPSDAVLPADSLRLIDTVHGMRMESAPFLIGRDLIQDAHRLLRNEGEARQAVISAASGCESMLDDLLCCLLWEKGERPEDWSTFFDQSLTKRVKSSQYSSRLRGSWTIEGDGPVGRWFRQVRAVRNKLVHGGEEPTINEAVGALDAATSLANFFADRLRERVSKYPRTAWMAGAPAFVSRKALDTHIRPLSENPSEPPWRETARRWETTMRQGMADGAWMRRDPADEHQKLVAVKHPTGDVVWAVVTESGRAARVDEPVELLVDGHREALKAVEVPDGVPAVNVGFIFERSLDQLPHASGPWLPAYHLVPGQPVMVTGEALDPP